jgi:predicted ester cyclase
MTLENAETNKRTIHRVFEEAINQDHMELLSELIAADFVGPRGDKGPTAFRAPIEGLRHGLSGLHYTLEDVAATEGDRVTVRWVLSGRHTGTLNGVAATNKDVRNDGMAVFQLERGRVVRAWLQTDRLGFLQQIGVVAPEIGAGAPPPK